MAIIPNQFRNIIGERQITSYDFLDLSKGNAIQLWYGLQGRAKYLLHETIVYSDLIETTANVTAIVANAKRLDIDFDMLFARPQILGGQIILNMVQGCRCESFGHEASTCTTYAIAKMRKYSGVTETELCNVQSKSLVVTATGIGSHGDIIHCMECTLPKTKFKAGDIFRMTIEIWSATVGVGGGIITWKVGFGHDPENRDSPSGIIDAGENTQLITFVPIKIDI